jgi:hypothetical protein
MISISKTKTRTIEAGKIQLGKPNRSVRGSRLIRLNHDGALGPERCQRGIRQASKFSLKDRLRASIPLSGVLAASGTLMAAGVFHAARGFFFSP